jgi:CRISPR/Cas system-associated exonuclease Cas4 (RecB family)
MRRGQKLIRASEIGEYLFCARAWWLRLEGHQPASGHEARAAGTRWHQQHGRSLRRAQLLRSLAALSILLALVAAALILVLWWRG